MGKSDYEKLIDKAVKAIETPTTMGILGKTDHVKKFKTELTSYNLNYRKSKSDQIKFDIQLMIDIVNKQSNRFQELI